MSRLDLFTILIVGVCILAIVFLIFKALEIANGNDNQKATDSSSMVTDTDDGYENDASIYDSEEITDDVATTDANAITDDAEGTTGYASTGGEISEDDAEEADDADETATSATTTTSDEPEIISSDASYGKYLVLAGTFKIKSNGEDHARMLRRKGYTNAKISIFDRGTYAVVLVDRFKSQSEANALVSQLKNQGIEAYVQLMQGAR